jgi:hypothetical protein
VDAVNFDAFIGPSYVAASRLAGNERLVNWYLEKNESPKASIPWALRPTPGLSTFATAATGPNRGLWAQDGFCLAVSGAVFYELTAAGVLTDRGPVALDTRRVTICSSGDAGMEAFITSGGSGYIFNLTTHGLSAPIAGLLADQGAYLDGYFLALDRATATFRISDLLDGLTWTSTQLAQRSSAGDRWQALLVSGQYIFLFGSETTDVWTNQGAFPFPFAPAGAVVQFGIAANDSAVDLNGVPYWLSQSAKGLGPVVRATGLGRPERISTHAVETAMRGYATVADAQGFGYEMDGHRFYVLMFPTAQAGWVFDETTDQWHEWLAWDAATDTYQAPRAVSYCYAFGRQLVGDRESGAIYTLSPAHLDDAGAIIRRMRRVPFPILQGDGHQVVLDQVRVALEPGVGLQTGQGSDPEVMLRVSRDGGATYGNERRVSAGAAGAFQTRVSWHRCGRFLDGWGVVEIVVTDPVVWALTGASFQARVGPS